MEIAPYINASFTPSATPAGTTPADHLANGLYAYINADKDPELKKRADATFGRTVPFDNSETQATLIGRSFASHTGYRQNPVQFLRDNKLPIPPNWSGENAQLYTQIGQHIISKYQEHYNNEKIKRDKAIADAQKDITDSFNRLPEAIADSVLQADGITSHTALDKDLLQSLTKYNQGENALTAQKRAALAWQYIAPAFESVDHLQDTNRRLLLDIANALSDEKGQLDPHALAAFVMLTDKKATELQSTNSEFWADFADKFQNYWRTTIDQSTKTGIGSAFVASTLPELQPTWGQQYQPPSYYGDERVEKLYGYMNQAINTAISPSEKAEWYAKLLSEMGGLVGESIVPMAAGIAAGAALAPAGAFAAAVAGYGAGVAASAPSTINNAIGNAYIKGVINPELYGTLEGIGQAAAENIGGPATSLKLFTKTAGKLTNYAASRAAGSRFLANQYARTTLNYLTAGAFESVTELAEEEIGGFIGSKLNAFARSMGFEVSPQAYQLGETLKDMKSHEVAAIFGYSYTLGLFGVPANFRDARNFAKNTDNLLKAGHTAKTARDIQLKVFQTEDKIADIIANPSLTQEQKDAAIRKEEQSLATYQQEKFINDALSDPKLRSRLVQEGRILRDEIEVLLDVEHEADLQILKEHNILEAVVIPGEKYKVSIYEPGELQQDGTRAPGKITTQEWSRMQLTNWLMLQKDTRIEQDLRAFQSLLLSHAHAQNATLEETKTHFQNLGANRPLAALGELHKHGITPAFFQKAAQQALQLQLQHQQEGLTPQEAAQQPSPDFQGLSLGQVQSLATAASQRAEQEIATTGALQNITEDTSIEYGGINLLTADGTALIKYVAGRATILDMLEERFEADIKQRTRGNQTLLNQLAETLLHIQSHLPGNIKLLDPKKKGNYTKSDLIEAYSKIAIGAFLYNEKNLPINAAGHRLIQNIGRAVDTTRMFQTIGNAWLTYANSPEGKAHLEAGGQTIADIMQEAGFTFSNQLASARATAQQRAQVLESRNYQPDIEQEVKALMDSAQQEQQLAEINQQEAKEPITIPADQSITGKEIVVDPVEEARNESEKRKLIEYYKWAIARDKKNLLESKRDLKTAKDAQARIRKALDKNNFRSKEEKDFVAYTLEHKVELESELQEDIVRLEKAIESNEAELEKIDSKEITIDPEPQSSIVNSQSSIVNPPAPAADLTGTKATTILSHMRDLIAKGKARAEHFAIVFREIPGLTEAQAIEQGIRPLTQRGEPTAAYTQGKLLAERCTDVQYQLLKSGKLPQKAKRDILGAPTQTRKNPAWPKIAKKGIATAEQRLTIIKALQNAVDYAAENPNYNLNFTRHIISKGREYYIATDGRRLAVIERTAPKGSKDIEESLDKNGNVVKDAKFPESWRHVLIALTDKAQTLDLAPFRFLETYPKTAINHVIWQDSEGKLSKYNPNYIGKGIKFFSTLSKAIGSPSTIQVDNQNMGPILMQSEHDGWTAKYLLMPMRLVDGDIYKEGDILLNPQDDSPADNLSSDDSLANFSIVGSSARTWDKYVQEGRVFKGRDDGMLRAEIDDSKAKLNTNFRNIQDLEDILVHPELFDAYPELRDITVIVKDLTNFEYPASAYRNGSIITLALDYVRMSDADEILGTLLHEIGHYIQEKEGFLSGGNPSSARFLLKKLIQQAESKEPEQWLDILSEKESILKEAKRLKTEIEQYEQANPEEYSLPDEIKNRTEQFEKIVKSYEKGITAKTPTGASFNATYLPSCYSFSSIHLMKDELAYLIDHANEHQNDFVAFREEMQRRIKNRRTLLERYKNLESFSDEELYLRIPGEIESRNVVNRRAWNEEERTSRPFNETLEYSSESLSNFSIRAANPSTLERFTADPLGERIVHTVRTEARRYARVLGDKTPQEQAVNAIASAESIINAVDKYLHRPDKPVSRRHRNQLTKLRSIIEKYAQIIASGTPRSFKRISPAEQQELQAAIAELEAAELDTAETDPALLIEDDKRMNKRTREAGSREHHRAIVREAAKGRVYKVLAAMLDTAADALDDYLKDQLLTKLHRLTATVAIKRTPSKRLKGKMTAPMYRELEQAIQLMAYSTRQKEDAVDTILTAHETLAQAIASNEDNLTHGNTLLIELAHQLEQDGTPVTAQTLTAALAAHEARVAIFADITSKNYEQTRTAANAIYHIIRYGRALWQQKHEAREAEIQTYLRHFLANTTAEQGKANAIRNMLEKFKWTDALSLNATMNAAQTLLALSSYEPLRPIMQQVLNNYATASVARQKHLQEMRKQELYLYARILGITPATQAGYSDKQLRHISDQFDTFYAENNKTIQTDITVTWQERNADGILETHTSEPLRLTKWEALNLILTYRQQDYQTNAQLHGYTDTVLDQLEKLIGTDLMDFGNGIQQALINDGTIAVYEEREGIPMRNNPLYWPGNININTLNTTREEPLVNPYHPAAGHDFLHTRVRHRNEIAHLNAFTVWRKAVADRANYIYSDPVTSHLESLLARQQFAGRLKTLIGEGLYRQLKATIAEIKNASWQETTLQDVNNTIVATAFASKSLAVLSGNPSSLIRQASAIANAGLMPGIMPGLTTAKYMKYAIGLKQGQGYIGISGILQLDSFTTRKRDNAYVNEMLAMGNDVKFSRLMDWAKAGMNWMDKLDLLANAFSAAIVYNHKYDELKTLGTLTEDQIKKQCENAVAVYTKLLAQPLNRTDKSALYWQLGNHALGRAVLFMSSESINKIGMLRANYIRMRNQGKNPAAALGILLGTMGITVGLTAAITEAALAILTGSLPDDDDNIAAWATALWLNASYGQYLGSLPLIGGVSDSIFSPYGGYFSGDLRLPGQDTIRYGGKLIEMLTDNKTYTAAQWEKETTRLMRDFTAVLGFAGGAYSRWKLYSQAAAFAHSFTAALNVLYPIARGVEARTGTTGTNRTSTRTRTRKPRRSKSKIEQWLTPDQK